MMAHDHEHEEYAYIDGLFVCRCGAVRLAVGRWADLDTSAEMKRQAAKATERLVEEHGTSVDAYGQRLSE